MKIYENSGISFMYPENWKLEEQEPDLENGAPREINLESENGHFWLLHVFDGQVDSQEIVNEVIGGLQQQYDDFEFNGQSESEVSGCKSIVGEANFYCLDFLVTASIQVIECGNQKFSILCQAESRDFDQMNQVFQAITMSLVMSELPTQSEA